VSTPLFAPWELVDSERKAGKLVYLSPRLARNYNPDGTVSYACLKDGVVLFVCSRDACTITLEGESNWASRYTCPLGCNHYRWWLHWSRDLNETNLRLLSRRADAILRAPQLTFVLLPRKYTAHYGGLGKRWMRSD